VVRQVIESARFDGFADLTVGNGFAPVHSF
jgi:hypothetical protein